MTSKYLAEFAGTFTFAMAGFVAASFIPNAKNSIVTTALIAGAALVLGVIVALRLGGQGALNPGFTIGAAVKGDFSYQVAGGFIASQILAVLAAFFLYRFVAPYLGTKVAVPTVVTKTA